MNHILHLKIAFLFFIALVLGSCGKGYTASGVVEKTEQGKDKYMLFMKDKQNITYRIIVSRTDMGTQYRDVVIGESVRVAGDTVHWQDEVHMKAKSIEVLK